jgi:putative flippase GtrA
VRLLSEQVVTCPDEQESIEEKKATKARPATSRWRRIVVQVGRFGVVGVFNTILDLCLFNVLLWILPTQNIVHILAYNSIAYSIGAINSFLLNKYWTFRRSYAVTSSEVMRFLLTTGAGILCSDLILWIAGMLLSHVGGNGVLLNNLAKLLAVAGTASVSYLGMNLWVFVRKSEA